jgi:hypothetical protein
MAPGARYHVPNPTVEGRMDPTRELIAQVSRDRMSRWLYYLCRDPLSCRQANVVRPGETRSSLDEADDYIEAELESMGYTVRREAHQAQAFRRDASKPLVHQYSRPSPEDPWYTLQNLYAIRRAPEPDAELLIVVAHKDSQSWIPCSPGANDNGAGTVALLELAYLLRDYGNQREIWFLWCNEEHTPWTSIAAAQQVAKSGRRVAAVLNLDGVGVRRPEDEAIGRYTAGTRYTSDRGRLLADLMAELIGRYDLRLWHTRHRSARPEDDDGSFIKAGIDNAILLTGWIPYPDPHYHTTEDRYEHVSFESVARDVQLALCFVLYVDRNGAP